jgi:hypothetical protein
MPLSDYAITGIVVELITENDLLINKGTADGVTVNMIFDILDPLTQDVIDPESGEKLGSIDRILTRVRVTNVQPRLSMATRLSPRSGFMSSTAIILSGYAGPSRPVGGRWPEGVTVSDPVGTQGKIWTPPQRAES